MAVVKHWKLTPEMSLCGSPLLHSYQATEQPAELSCHDCIFRVLAQLHHDTGIMLQLLATEVVKLRAAAERGVRRD